LGSSECPTHRDFAKTAGIETGSLARPNVLLDHFPLEGSGRDDECRVEKSAPIAPGRRLKTFVTLRGNCSSLWRRMFFTSGVGERVRHD
jgi:hypothetical protein